ncbi:mitotic-spindle organizing protein 1 [Paracoccidioides brasiliensis Pb18]|uniref:Mitotic-spindle organizing protein 1 n=2 Tax=Paracoccidioides TaxID=38946 RepID=C1G2E0_PARBD|nr:mitotic-spindle organizing protein 1 [Paracoccidioides brasiliensis Pb18]XP_015703605.1 mitotic-spindle organizing protein 1 [Paracoccidioides lutzii Pb01]EEH46156.1 mitotic-spindle organizing protein 1 [Paracoccidioides brasiliensis Pb18]KGQ02142.1 mitotic-spindle organizing protein 1 [Paracoccidioides lutzii Pb01]
MPAQPHQQQQQQQQDDKRQAAREVIDILHEISTILNTHLDRTELSLCVSLIENGVNPEALAAVIKELRKEAAATPAVD